MSHFHAEDVINAYRRIAPYYYWVFGWVFEHGRIRMGKQIGSLQPQRLLEVGVGTGIMLHRYPQCCEIHGIDMSQEMLQLAARRASELDSHNIQLRQMNAEALEYPDDHFDCVTLPHVLSVTPDASRLIAEARRVCRPDGHIIILNYFSDKGPWRFLKWLPKVIGTSSGFDPDFSYACNIPCHDWKVITEQGVNMFNLSRMIVIKNEKK